METLFATLLDSLHPLVSDILASDSDGGLNEVRDEDISLALSGIEGLEEIIDGHQCPSTASLVALCSDIFLIRKYRLSLDPFTSASLLTSALKCGLSLCEGETKDAGPLINFVSTRPSQTVSGNEETIASLADILSSLKEGTLNFLVKDETIRIKFVEDVVLWGKGVVANTIGQPSSDSVSHLTSVLVTYATEGCARGVGDHSMRNAQALCCISCADFLLDVMTKFHSLISEVARGFAERRLISTFMFSNTQTFFATLGLRERFYRTTQGCSFDAKKEVGDIVTFMRENGETLDRLNDRSSCVHNVEVVGIWYCASLLMREYESVSRTQSGMKNTLLTLLMLLSHVESTHKTTQREKGAEIVSFIANHLSCETPIGTHLWNIPLGSIICVLEHLPSLPVERLNMMFNFLLHNKNSLLVGMFGSTNTTTVLLNCLFVFLERTMKHNIDNKNSKTVGEYLSTSLKVLGLLLEVTGTQHVLLLIRQYKVIPVMGKILMTPCLDGNIYKNVLYVFTWLTKERSGCENMLTSLSPLELVSRKTILHIEEEVVRERTVVVVENVMRYLASNMKLDVEDDKFLDRVGLDFLQAEEFKRITKTTIMSTLFVISEREGSTTLGCRCERVLNFVMNANLIEDVDNVDVFAMTHPFMIESCGLK